MTGWLACFWWKEKEKEREKGACKYSEEECLYAHFWTLSVASKPNIPQLERRRALRGRKN